MIEALLILVNILFYYRTTKWSGICDDIPVFNQPVEVPKNKWMYFWYHLHGRKYVSWKLARWQTITIHTINCILVYKIFGSNTVSAMAAFLFALNPVNNQCSIWLSGKGYSMNVTCALLMWAFPLASPLLYIYGLYFHGASLLLFPLMFVFTKHWYLVFLILWGLQREHARVFNKKDPTSKFNTESNEELLSIAPRKLIVYFKTLGYYLINAVAVWRLGYYHKYLFLHGVDKENNKKSYKIDGFFFVGIALILVTLITRNVYLCWYVLTLSMWCNFISFNQTIANRYLYLPNAALMVLVAKILYPYPVLYTALLIYYIVSLAKFLVFYKNEYWSIEWSVIEQPDFFYPWQNRAVHCFHQQNFQGSLANMLKANELRPNDWKICYNICQIYLIIGNMDASKHWFEVASKYTIDGREEAIAKLMKRLKDWMDKIEEQAKQNNNKVDIDLRKVDMQR